MKTKKIAIITADIMDSTEIDIQNKPLVMQQFDSGLHLLKHEFDLEYEWYRGDAFQMKINDLKDSYKILLLTKFWFKSFERNDKKSHDVRISLGIGTISINHKGLALSDGEAFRISGQNLDNLKQLKQSFIADSDDENANALKIESMLLNSIIETQTAIQSKVVFHKIRGIKEESIAKLLGLAQSTVNQHSNAGNWNTISKYLDYFNKLYTTN